MNAEKYTEKTIELIRLAQTISKDRGSQQIEQEHLLLAMLTQENGLVPQLLRKMGQDTEELTRQAEALCDRLPRVSGAVTSMNAIYAARIVDEIFTDAEKRASRMNDDYVSVEHVMLSFIEKCDGECARLLSRNNITTDNFLKVLAEVRGGTRVTSDNPEDTYDALSKYGQDLVSLAEQQKLDPVIGR